MLIKKYLIFISNKFKKSIYSGRFRLHNLYFFKTLRVDIFHRKKIVFVWNLKTLEYNVCIFCKRDLKQVQFFFFVCSCFILLRRNSLYWWKKLYYHLIFILFNKINTQFLFNKIISFNFIKNRFYFIK